MLSKYFSQKKTKKTCKTRSTATVMCFKVPSSIERLGLSRGNSLKKITKTPTLLCYNLTHSPYRQHLSIWRPHLQASLLHDFFVEMMQLKRSTILARFNFPSDSALKFIILRKSNTLVDFIWDVFINTDIELVRFLPVPFSVMLFDYF